MQPRLNYQKQRGITLIEVLVSMLIFSVGILGMSALQLRVLKQTQDQNQRDIAIWRAQAIIDRITINNSPAAINAYLTNINNSNFCANTPAQICAETYNIATNSEVAAAVCSETELANYDSWEILCATDEGINRKLANLTPLLECNGIAAPPCAVGSPITIQLSWQSHAANADPRLTGNTTILQADDGTVVLERANIERYRQVFIP